MYCDFHSAHFKFRLDAELNGNTVTIPTIKDINYFPGINKDKEPLRINLSHMLRVDRRLFAKQNEREDERHQVDLDSLEIRGISIYENVVPMVSIDYIFKVDNDGWGRCAYGELTDIGEPLEHDYEYEDITAKKGECLPINFYTKGAHVTW